MMCGIRQIRITNDIVLRVDADSADEALDIVQNVLQRLVDREARARRLEKTDLTVEGVFNVKGRGTIVVTTKPHDLVWLRRTVSSESSAW